MTFACKNFAKYNRHKISRSSGLSGIELTLLLVQMWKGTKKEYRFEWILMANRESFLKKEEEEIEIQVKCRLVEIETVEDRAEKIAKADALFCYMSTAPMQRFLHHHDDFRRAVIDKLREFRDEENIALAERWAKIVFLNI